MARGGSRVGAGRKVGTRNQRTVDKLKKTALVAALVEKSLPKSFKGDAHALLMSVYKNQSLPLKMRLEAATAAIGFEKAKLSATKLMGDADNPVQHHHEVRWTVLDPRTGSST